MYATTTKKSGKTKQPSEGNSVGYTIDVVPHHSPCAHVLLSSLPPLGDVGALPHLREGTNVPIMRDDSNTCAQGMMGGVQPVNRRIGNDFIPLYGCEVVLVGSI